ncbi:embryonic polarity protein dorsal-like [Schistocerca cancellata]|uniref:embryonic polarity protein dorsal-like n=1 Tax=Schistocerca cancellata TaxID=274614 RepID=UPI002118F4F3|nr:embryonic polarity protein dorsal-like [Schistocerca cancellata]
MTGGSIAVSTVPTNNIRTVPKPANTALSVQASTSPGTIGSAVVSEELKTQPEGENTLKEDNNDGEVMEAKPEAEQETETSRSLKELLSQVAELDEIYSDTRARLLMPSGGDSGHPPETVTDEPMEVTEAELAAVVAATENLPEDDTQTYSSLQMAMKNPVVDLLEADRDRYEDVAAPVVPPLISIAPVPPPHGKRDVPAPVTPDAGSERLPPLPPKRSRKSPPGRPDHPPPPQLQQQVHASVPQIPSSASPPASPPPTDQPLPAEPRSAKPTLFQKLFSKKKNRKDSTGGRSREGSAQRQSSPSPSRPEEDVIFIPLTGQPELTEAEHYALYTDVAPHATASEFDEMSFYYSPVEGGRILTQQQSQPPEARPRDIFA